MINIKGVENPEIIPDGKNCKVAIVHTRWNMKIVQALLSQTKDTLDSCGCSDIHILTVPGSYELPYASSQLAKSGKYDAVIAIGVLIKGETMHFEYIADAVSHGLMKVQLETDVPVIFGVLTCLNESQALKRAGFDGGHNHGQDWAYAAVQMAHLRADLNK